MLVQAQITPIKHNGLPERHNFENRNQISNCQFHTFDNNFLTEPEEVFPQYISNSPANTILHRLDSAILGNNWKNHYIYNTQNSISQMEYFSWDEDLSAWRPSFKWDYSHTNNGFLSNETRYNYTSQWVPSFKRDYTYYSNGNVKTLKYDLFSDNEWRNSYKRHYTYNENGKILLVVQSNWNSEQAAYTPGTRTEYNYDTNGNLIEVLSKTWSNETSEWMLNQKQESTFNANGKITIFIQSSYSQSNQIWTPTRKVEYTYNSNGDILQYMEFDWSTTDNDFINKMKYAYTYPPSQREMQRANWTDNSYWLNVKKIVDTYDNLDNMILNETYNWNQTNNNWIPEFKYDFIYDLNLSINDLILPFWIQTSSLFRYKYLKTNYYMFNEENNDWTLFSADENYYSEQSTTAINNLNPEFAAVYPNPASGEIRVITADSPNALLQLINIQGRIVLSQNVTNNETISLEGINNGLYIYRLILDGKATTGKLVVQ